MRWMIGKFILHCCEFYAHLSRYFIHLSRGYGTLECRKKAMLYAERA